MIFIKKGEAIGKVSTWARVMGFSKRTLYERLGKDSNPGYVLYAGRHKPGKKPKQGSLELRGE